MSDWIDQVFCEDAIAGLARIPDGAIDLILTDPPYNLGKDYGNDSDQQRWDPLESTCRHASLSIL